MILVEIKDLEGFICVLCFHNMKEVFEYVKLYKDMKVLDIVFACSFEYDINDIYAPDKAFKAYIDRIFKNQDLYY